MMNVTMPKVSVIIPIYNAEKYLNQCMESVANQSLKEIEIICVEDGSTDNSLRILEGFKNKDSRITILKQENQYAGVARNNGMKLAKGAYLCFLDADDIFEPTMLEEAYNQAKRVNADIVVFGGKFFEEDISKAYDYPALLRMDMLPDKEVFEPDEDFEYLFNFTTPAPWNKLFKKSFIEKSKLYFQKCKRINDAYFVEVSLALAKRIGIVDKKLIYYRTNNSLSLQGSIDKSPLQFVKVFREIKEKLNEIDKGKISDRSFRNLCLSICIYNLELITQAEPFEELYNGLKEYIFELFEIKGTNEDEYYNKYAYNQYICIMNSSPTGYLLGKLRNHNIRKEYLFPFGDVEKGSRIILYAAGNVGKSYYRQIKKTQYCNVVTWVDKKIRFFENINIKSPEEIMASDCDYIVIAIENESIAQQIKTGLVSEYKVEPERIIWCQP